MSKAHIGEEDWGFHDYQERRNEIANRKATKRQKKESRRRLKREKRNSEELWD